jgi:hypothetical protein
MSGTLEGPGCKTGSGEINGNSLSYNRASGGPVAGYSPAKGWPTSGAPLPEHGASQHVGGAANATDKRKSPPPEIGAVGMKNGGKMPKPSRTER